MDQPRAVRRPAPPSAGLSRRRLLWLAVAAPVLVSCARPWASVPAAPAPPPGPVSVRTRWRARPDGPIPPTGDEGVPFAVTAPHGRQPSVSGGALVGNLPDTNAATYVMQGLTTKILRIGAEFGFDPGNGAGSLGLIAWIPFADATAHCHVAFAPDRWIAATVENGELDEIGSGHYSTPLVQDGRPYRVEVVIDGATTYITLPDGSVVRSGPSEGVARIAGTAPCWEFFREEPGSTSVRLYETWAS